MQAYTYLGNKDARWTEKPMPQLQSDTDAIVRVTLSSICTSDLHILHGSVPRAVAGVTLGHEAVGIVERIGAGVTRVQVGDRVAINVETFCGECFFCRRGWVNNCTDPDGGWALGCRIDGMQAPYVRVPHADCGLSVIPPAVTDEQALFTGDILATGYWAADIGQIAAGDTVLVLGGGPTGVCCMLCARLYHPAHIIVSEADEWRRAFLREHYPDVIVVSPSEVHACIGRYCGNGGADVVIEAAGTEDSFATAWQCARPNAVVVIVAMYDKAQELPLPQMYGKNLTFKTGGVDGCQCNRILQHIAAGELDTTALITHTYDLADAEEAYRVFAARDRVYKVALRNPQ